MVRVLCIQTKPVIGDKGFNINYIEQQLIKVNEKIDLVVLPEFFSTGISHEVFVNEPEDSNGGETILEISRLALKYDTNIVAGTVIEKDNNKLYNTAFIIDRKGKVLDKYRKIHLFDYMGGSEGTRITPGNRLVIAELDFGKIGLGICYDIRYPLHYKKLAQLEADIIVLPTAWIISGDKYLNTLEGEQDMWIALNRVRAYDNMVYTVSCNQTGLINENIGAIGNSMIVSPLGEVIVNAGNEEGFIAAELDLSIIKNLRASYPISTID